MPRQKLTDKSIRGLKTPAIGQVDIWDELLPGFGIRVGAGGRKAFIVGTRVKGKFRRITLKPAFPELELAAARSRARQIIADAQSGIGPELRAKRSEKGTFGAVASSFMEDFAKKHRTRGEMQRKIEKELADWHDRQISDITRSEIKELLRVKARAAPISANRLKALISKIFKWAVKEEIIQASPAIGLDPPGGAEDDRQRDRNLKAEEVRSVWMACDQIGYPFGPLFKMLLVTGQRRGEVAGMKWSEIAEDGWRLPNERAKKGKGHLVPLSTLAREILSDVPQIGEYVFRSRNDKPLQGWSNAKERMDALAPIPDWHLHDLRRTFATQLRTLGVDRLVVSKRLNHAEAGVTQVYDRYSADPEKAAAMELWANRLREIISGTPSEKIISMRGRRSKG
jgi:integrase